MKSMYDVVVIGAGVTGAAIARELSRYYLSIAVLEKEAEPAFGVSKSNSGIIHPGTQNDPKLLKSRLCVRGNNLVKKLSKQLDLDFQQVGELIAAFTQEDMVKLRQIKVQAEKLGVLGLRIVDRKWLDKNEPNLNKNIIAGLYAPTAGIISPYRFVYALLENAHDNGVCLKTNTKVIAINKIDNGFDITTSKENIQARYVINAAGLFADEVCRMVGINDITIIARKGEEFLLDKKRQNITNHLIFPLPSPNSKGILVIKTSDGNPMIGPTADDIDSKADHSTTDQGFSKVLAATKNLVPSIQEKDVIAYFAGLRPVAGDDFIIRAEQSVNGFITVAGIQSPGLTAALAIGEYVVSLLKTAKCQLRKKWFFKSRQKKFKHLFNIPLPWAKKLIKKDPEYGDIVCRCELVSAKEIKQAIKHGACTMDGIKFRTRAQAGRCHGSFCSTRVMKILAKETGQDVSAITKRGKGSEIIQGKR